MFGSRIQWRAEESPGIPTASLGRCRIGLVWELPRWGWLSDWLAPWWWQLCQDVQLMTVAPQVMVGGGDLLHSNFLIVEEAAAPLKAQVSGDFLRPRESAWPSR